MRSHALPGMALVAAAVTVLSCTPARLPLGLDLYRPVPDGNALTAGKISLGRRLFFERRLSRDGTMSCSGCHEPDRAFADNRRVAVGIGGARGRRNVPTLVNRAWGRRFFWDGRVQTLEAQAIHPMLNPLEMGATPASVLSVVRSERYAADFQRAFGDREPSLDDIGAALAAYVRTIVAGNSPYDRYARGDRSALSDSARRGFDLFFGRAGCAACHTGPTFTDEQFHNTGVAWAGEDFSDLGRAAVTGSPRDRGAFKTPTLREVSRTAPYMHDGRLATLESVVTFYVAGGRPNPHLDQRLRPLDLTPKQQEDLVAFLRSLSGEVRDGH